MTTIALLGTNRSAPNKEELARALPSDKIIQFDGPEWPAHASELEVSMGASAPEAIEKLLASAPKLKWLHMCAADMNRAMSSKALIARSEVIVTNNSGAYDVPISEYVLSAMLAASKHLPDYQRLQQGATWDQTVQHSELRGGTVVILGLGSIGGEVARLASAFGMTVIGVRRRIDGPPVPGVARVIASDGLAHAVADADFLVITSPLTAATRGLVTREIIARLKPTAWLVNIGRGPIVDEPALLEALREKRIGGAALDVWWTEPLPADSPWWGLPNVIATPHASGQGTTPEVRERTLALFVENLGRWRAGKPMLNVVDRKTGY